jgi:hypothetical protein
MRAVTGPRPVWTLLAMAALLAATPALAACGTGEQGGSPYVAEFGLGADTPEARDFDLTPMPGSGSCPSGPDSVEVVAEQEIEIRVGPLFPDRDPCTADMSPHVTVVELPQGITPTKQLVARFGKHEVTIEATSR